MSDRMTAPWGQPIDPNASPGVMDPSQMQSNIMGQRPEGDITGREDNSEEELPFDAVKVSKQESDKILEEAVDRFRYCEEREAMCRERYMDDLKFVEGDSDNNWQWPTELYKMRDNDQRPTLTVNKVRQHCLQIINDAKQNKPGIVIDPVSDDASYDAAQLLEGLARHVEYISNAQTVYDNAVNFQVKGGIGWWRVITDYVSPDSFDQDIFIVPVKDPLTIYMDPDITQIDGSDARYCFAAEVVPKDLFLKQHPEFKNVIGSQPPLGVVVDWTDDEHVIKMEYWRKVEKKDTLISYVNDQGQRETIMQSKIDRDLAAMLKEKPDTRTREVLTDDVEWYLIYGSRVVEKRKWPGKYIPMVRIIGEESIIDGQIDRKGHVRYLKDPQRIYNYWTSSAVEQVALQSKAPYVAAAEAIEGYETYWNNMNVDNPPVLPYRSVGDNGAVIPEPKRQDPPVMAPAYIQGLEISNKEMMMVSGQYQSMMGEPSNERSGRAIQERQRQGDNATYHYVDGEAIGIRFTGKIFVDLWPHVYDTKRILQIVNKDGTQDKIQIDPELPQAAMTGQTVQMQNGQEQTMSILNPNVGRYEVRANVGPAYATARQEAFNAMSQILVTRPELTAIIGDLLFQAADFPMSKEAAERLKRMVPLQALGDAPPPEVIQLQTQVQNLQLSLTSAIQQLADKASEIKVDQEQKAIDVFKAETDRLKVLVEQLDPNQIATLTAQIVMQTLSNKLDDVERTTEAFLAPPLVPPGATNLLGQEDPNITGGLVQELGNEEAEALPDGQMPAAPGGGGGMPSPAPGGAQGGAVVTDAGGPEDAIAGIRKARDGQYYLPDPNRPGKYLQVM